MPLGERLPVESVQASAVGDDPSLMLDGRVESEWKDIPQRPGQWVIVDLGHTQQVGGVMHATGEAARDFPRRLAIDVSIDGSTWDEVWQGQIAAHAFRAAVLRPRESAMAFAFPARQARFVRLRQLASHRNYWRIAELTVHAPR
jgi:hypothetical protein